MNEDQALQRYSRHLLLPEVGFEGVGKIRAARVLLIGMGGIGCPVAQILVASGIGELIMMDHDTVELTNLQRQLLYTEAQIGESKVLAARQRLQSINPVVRLTPIAQNADEQSLPALIAPCDVVVDATDRFATRHLINRVAMRAQKPLIVASALGFDAQIFFAHPNHPLSPCYECLFPENEGAQETSCALMGVFAPITALVGAWAAHWALMYCAGLAVNSQQLMLIDGRSGRTHSLATRRAPNCPLHH